MVIFPAPGEKPPTLGEQVAIWCVGVAALAGTGVLFGLLVWMLSQ